MYVTRRISNLKQLKTQPTEIPNLPLSRFASLPLSRLSHTHKQRRGESSKLRILFESLQIHWALRDR
ncbi:hypothetical protein AKJ16_DCAP05219 [Drosera capensis]